MHAQTLHGIKHRLFLDLRLLAHLMYERHFIFFSKVEKQKKRILVLYHYIE